MPNCFAMTKMKWELLQDILDKKRKVYEVAEIFKVSRKSVSQWLCKYKQEWLSWIIPKKPWPKSWETHNRTDSVLEDEICRLWKENPFEWPIWISDQMYELYEITIDHLPCIESWRGDE